MSSSQGRTKTRVDATNGLGRDRCRIQENQELIKTKLGVVSHSTLHTCEI
jgi:hypothetical protein